MTKATTVAILSNIFGCRVKTVSPNAAHFINLAALGE
jgi:hypothetical protein